jgi:hemolysin activation/secretion protein
MQLKSGFEYWCALLIDSKTITCRMKKVGVVDYEKSVALLFSFIVFGNLFCPEFSLAQTIINSHNSTPTFLVPAPGLATAIKNRKTGKDIELQSSSFAISDRQIKIKNIQVSGNTLFETEIERLTEAFRGKSATLSELYELRASISKIYTDNGYLNSGAYLPPQKIQNGLVKIEVLEGGIETIEITGNKHLRERYIASRLQSLPTPIKTEQLLERLQLLRLNPLIENISAELSAGLTPGMSRLDIKVKEADTFTLSSSLNNHKSPSVGSNSRNIGIAHVNLLGLGDTAQLNYTNTEGSNELDLGYALPINAKNGTITLAYGFGSNDIIENPFTPLDIETKSDYYELTLRQPIIYQPNREVALGLSFSRQHSETSLLNSPFPLSIGADESGNTNVSALRFFQEFTQRSDKSVWALRSQFSLGVDLFDATINDNAPDSSFLAWRGQSKWVRQLDDDFLFLVQGDIQLANNLVPLEQFRLGGSGSVRGYRRDISLSDSGILASAELRTPVLRINKLDGVVQLVPFFDLGLPWSGDNATVDVDFLVSLGMGLNFTAGERFNARLDYGIPLTDIKVDGDSLQENGVTFSLGYSF